MSLQSETVDVVIVGSRCAGSAAGIALARAGRRVVALDRAAFPSDTISTHLLWPAGLAEIQALGALERVRALGAPPLPTSYAGGAGHAVRGTFTPVDGIDHAMCVRRTGLDAALVSTAREAGVELRERSTVTALVRDGDRVTGVTYTGSDGQRREIRAQLVIGADGRRSCVAREVGADEPYRLELSGRACYFAYWRDDEGAERDVAAQWREGAELGTAFPCDDGLVLVLLQPPVERVAQFRGNTERAYLDTIARIPGLAERLVGATLETKIRSATDIASYFRRSQGPGWALVGDAGHFKDPVTAQGIRDALRFGRLLGEAAAPWLDDRVLLDDALAAWETRRDAECLETFQWTNVFARGEEMTALERELYRDASRSPELARELLDVFSRVRKPTTVFTARRAVAWTTKAAVRRPRDLRQTLRQLASDVRTARTDRRERLDWERTRPTGDAVVEVPAVVPTPREAANAQLYEVESR